MVPGFYLVLLGFTGFYLVFLGLLSMTYLLKMLNQVLPSLTELEPGQAESYLVLLGLTKFSWVC